MFPCNNKEFNKHNSGEIAAPIVLGDILRNMCITIVTSTQSIAIDMILQQ